MSRKNQKKRHITLYNEYWEPVKSTYKVVAETSVDDYELACKYRLYLLVDESNPKHLIVAHYNYHYITEPLPFENPPEDNFYEIACVPVERFLNIKFENDFEHRQRQYEYDRKAEAYARMLDSHRNRDDVVEVADRVYELKS